ncbi:DUF1643 domain-containing protein [Microbacterium murale]|uniref:DUF1643 domain-containing protein n=1 Tax=Microbacterium murale TaxID=1081040 RepID=UPI00166F6214|nr:DUF1643 domain-containing protein [Microbacterium murale]
MEIQESVDGIVESEREWLYEHAADGSARFVLGEAGQNPLVCVGINPSTAVPNAPDPTIKRVRRFAADNGYDGWTMLNVYPQIATDPKDIDREHRAHLKAENEQHITRLVSDRPVTLLAAWGGLVTSRPYLPALLRDILEITTAAGCDWVSLGAPTKYGHPRHPLYVRGDTLLQSFDTGEYLRASF